MFIGIYYFIYMSLNMQNNYIGVCSSASANYLVNFLKWKRTFRKDNKITFDASVLYHIFIRSIAK